MAYTRPQVRVFQQLTSTPTLTENVRRPHLFGPNAILHRYSVDAEKALIYGGSYDRFDGNIIPYPERQAGSVVDQASVKIVIENGLLHYFETLIGQSSNGHGVNYNPAGHRNHVKNNTVRFRTAGGQARSTLLKDRDVQIGDVVRIHGVEDPEGDCIEHELWSTVAGFVATPTSASVGDPIADPANGPTQTYNYSFEQTAGPVNCVDLTGIDEPYDGLASGILDETYTISVIQSSVAGCTSARLRITSASGTDNVAEVTPSAMGSPTNIGTRGLAVTFAVSNHESSCDEGAATAGVPADLFVVGQVWTVTTRGQHVRSCIETDGTYDGTVSDTYIVEVTKGAAFGAGPEVTVTTVNGSDRSIPQVVASTNTVLNLGTHGLVFSFNGCGDLNGNPYGLRKGDKHYVSVTAPVAGPVHTLVLRDDLPTGLLGATELDLQLFIPRTITLDPQRKSAAPLLNYTTEDTQVVLHDGILAYDSSWTLNGVQLPLVLWSSVNEPNGRIYGSIYIEYREFVSDLANKLSIGYGVDELDSIPGQLDPQNPLKYAYAKAIANSNGSGVAYTAVSDPDDLNAWGDALSVVEGRREVYNLIPLSSKSEVHSLAIAAANNEGAPGSNNWKAAIISAEYLENKMIVGSENPLTPIVATLSDNPSASGSQFTLLSTVGSASFITDGVRAGDTVRYLYNIDGFGNATYSTFVVDRVLSETSLLLLAGPNAPVGVAQRVEVWRKLDKSEIVDAFGAKASAQSDWRVVLIAPDYAEVDGQQVSGYFLAAAFGGLVGSVLPHQGLTRVQIKGFDNVAARTRDFFTVSQLDRLAEYGVTIITADATGATFIRHALTTDMSTLERREEVMRRNFDSIGFDLLDIVNPYIGPTNATSSVLRVLRSKFDEKFVALTTVVVNPELGAQLQGVRVKLDAQGNEIFRIHPLAKDRLELAFEFSLPGPTNVIDMYMIA